MTRTNLVAAATVAVLQLSCTEYEPDPEYVHFFLTVEVGDDEGRPVTCGELGIVRVRASVDTYPPRTRCCESATSSLLFELLPESDEMGEISAEGFGADGFTVALAFGVREAGAMEGKIVLEPCNDCGFLETNECASTVQ